MRDKPHLSNHGSHFVHIVRGPGLSELQYASGRLVSGHRQYARLVLLKENGETVEAKRTKLDWKPYLITAEFEFPGGLHVIQRSWVEDQFAHSSVTFKGAVAGARLAAEGASYDDAKVMVSSQGSVMVEEMTPAYKPAVMEIVSTVFPDRVMLSDDGKTWKQSDYAWSEERVHYRMVFDQVPREMVLSAHVGKLSNFVPREDWERSRRREVDVKKAWLKAYDDDLPDIECPEQKYRDLVQFCWYVHHSSVLNCGGMLPYKFVVPSKLTYPMWWMWDTAFHAIVDVWMRDKSIAFGTLLNHTIMQSKKGCIPDAGGAYYGDTGTLKWVHPEQYDNNPPPCTGPPVTALGAWDVYQKTGDLEFVKKMYPHLVVYERWLIEEKNSKIDPDLIAYYYWTDVGWDDSKRWGKSGMNGKDIGWDLPVIPVDGNVFLLILRNTLSNFADLLGETHRRREYAEKAARTRRAIDNRMWNEEQGFYFDLHGDGKMMDVWTPAGFVPMLAGIPGADTYQRLRAHLLDPKKFWTKYPLPTLALDDPDCAYASNWWRGGVWPVINWQVNEGLFRYDPDLGLRLLDATVDMMTRDGFPTCTEYYNPVMGDAKGAIDQGWGAMPVDLILRRMMGLNPNPSGLELKPCLPADWPEASVRNVFAVGTSVEVRYLRSGDGLKAAVKNTGKKDITVTAGSNRQFLEPGDEGMLVIP